MKPSSRIVLAENESRCDANRKWRAEQQRLRVQLLRLRQENQALQQEVQTLRRENQALRLEKAGLEAKIAALQQRIDELQAALQQAQRQARRQAAPFSKGEPKKQPRKRGRKPGAAYGKKAHRPPPPPDQIDEVEEAPLPSSCPHCGGAIAEEKVVPQYQVEIPRRPIYRRFNVHVGSCQRCGRRLQGTHPLQTSDALGAAASQLGPDAQAAIAFLNKYGGLSHGKIVRVFEALFGIPLTRGASAQIVLRAGRRCLPAYQQIGTCVRRSPWVVADETGWKVGGRGAWLHTLVGERATWYGIDPHRDAKPAASILGWDYAGAMIHDGCSIYDRFHKARHQQCVQHVLRRARQMLDVARGIAARFPRQVIALLEEALQERDEYRAGRRSADELAEAALRLVDQLEKLTSRPYHNAANARLAKHLRNHRWQWFWFLLEPDLDATNYRAEQALRLGVINRKVWGGNRDESGRTAQQVLMSINATCFRHDLCPVDYISRALRTWAPQLIPP